MSDNVKGSETNARMREKKVEEIVRWCFHSWAGPNTVEANYIREALLSEREEAIRECAEIASANRQRLRHPNDDPQACHVDACLSIEAQILALLKKSSL